MGQWAGFVGGVLAVVTLLASAFAAFYMQKRRSTREYSTTLTDIVQGQEVELNRLRAELATVTQHRDQLLIERTSWIEQFFGRAHGVVKEPKD